MHSHFRNSITFIGNIFLMKKILLLSFFIFSFSFTKAQWVTIPDANFVAWLSQEYPSCMNGNLMDTTCSWIVNDTYVDVTSLNISNLSGIQFFDNLQHLDCSINDLSSLPSLPNTLTFLSCYDNNLNSLPVLPNSLTEFDCIGNNLTALPDLPNNLTLLFCSYNSLANLPPLPNSLQGLYCSFNQLINLPTLPNSLLILDCSSNQLTSLPTLPNQLEWLLCYYNQISTIPNFPNSLTYLQSYNNQITSVPFFPNSLPWIALQNNLLTSLPNLPNSLNFLTIQNNPIQCLPSISHFFGAPSHFDISGTLITCLPNYIEHIDFIPAIDTMPICDQNNLNGCPPCLSDTSFSFMEISYGDSIFLSNDWQTTPGIYSYHLNSNTSCDSVIMVTLTVDTTSSNIHLIYKNNFSLYPNPTSENISVEYNINTSGTLTIYNLLGQKKQEIILEKNTSTKNISLTNIPSGIYFCVIKTEDGKTMQQKLVVEK